MSTAYVSAEKIWLGDEFEHITQTIACSSDIDVKAAWMMRETFTPYVAADEILGAMETRVLGYENVDDRHLVIVGAPGCGKHAIVRWMVKRHSSIFMGEREDYLRPMITIEMDASVPDGVARVIGYEFDLTHASLESIISRLREAGTRLISISDFDDISQHPLWLRTKIYAQLARISAETDVRFLLLSQRANEAAIEQFSIHVGNPKMFRMPVWTEEELAPFLDLFDLDVPLRGKRSFSQHAGLLCALDSGLLGDIIVRCKLAVLHALDAGLDNVSASHLSCRRSLPARFSIYR